MEVKRAFTRSIGGMKWSPMMDISFLGVVGRMWLAVLLVVGSMVVVVVVVVVEDSTVVGASVVSVVSPSVARRNRESTVVLSTATASLDAAAPSVELPTTPAVELSSESPSVGFTAC